MDDIQNILNAMMREAVSPQTAAVAIAVIGLNIHFGYTGLLNIGQSAFMLLGAYGFAISITEGSRWCVGGHRRAAGLAFVFALVLGVPTLKLRGDYLAIVTISAAEIVRYVGRSVGYERLFNLTGGAQGIPGSRYREPFTDLSPFGERQHARSWSFNYTDVAGGPSVGVRLIGWVVVIALIWIATVRIGRGQDARSRASPARSPSSALSVLAVSWSSSWPRADQQNTGVDGWWFTVVAWVLVGLSLLIVARA